MGFYKITLDGHKYNIYAKDKGAALFESIKKYRRYLNKKLSVAPKIVRIELCEIVGCRELDSVAIDIESSSLLGGESEIVGLFNKMIEYALPKTNDPYYVKEVI